jgi:hypothetical protein
MMNVTKEPSDDHKNIPQRRNLGISHWEIQWEDTRHDYSECTRCTQEISKHQK